MRNPWIGGWRVESGLVGLARLHSRGHLVVYLQYDPFGAVLPVRLLIFSFDKGKCPHDVFRVIPVDPVQVEESGV